jgi:hypothetical protein
VTLFDGAVAAGAAGWRTNRATTRWTFRDPSGSAARGITKLTLRDRSARSPGVFALKLNARTLTAGPPAPPLPLRFAFGILPGFFGPRQLIAGIGLTS